MGKRQDLMLITQVLQHKMAAAANANAGVTKPVSA